MLDDNPILGRSVIFGQATEIPHLDHYRDLHEIPHGDIEGMFQFELHQGFVPLLLKFRSILAGERPRVGDHPRSDDAVRGDEFEILLHDPDLEAPALLFIGQPDHQFLGTL